MAITEIKVSGKLYEDDGDAVNGATVALLETGTSTQEASTTTDSNGAWSFTETSLDATYDVKFTQGNSVRYILWSDEIALKGVDTASLKVRGVEGAAAPIYLFADQADDAGDAWRIQASASDTLAIGSDKAVAGTIIDYVTITNGANAAASVVALGGNLTVGGDLTISGDDLTMGTNTSTAILVADGTNYNPVVPSGVIDLANDGAFTLDNTVISSQTEISSGLVVADELLYSDGGVIKKIGLDNFIELAPTLATEDAIANGDYILFLDGGATGNMNKEAVHDLATLFAGAGMTATSSVVNVIGGDGITANSNDVAITAAQTTITSVLNASLVVGRDAHNDIDFTTDNTIRFRVGNEDQLTLTDGALTPTTNAIVDLGTDDLEFKDAYFDGTVEADAISIGGTTVSATAAEINLIDGGTARGTTAVASGDGILINDGGTMRMTNVDTASTYFASHSVGGGNIVTTGALASGTIASGFGTISTDNTITTTALISGGSLDIDHVLIDGTTIGHTDDTDLITLADGIATVAGEISVTTLDIGGTNVSATAVEINYLDITTLGTSEASKAVTVDSNGDLLVPDSDKYKFGAGSDMQLYHDGTDSYMTNATGALKIATETSGIAVTIGHTTSETTVADNLSVTGTVFINESANTFMDNGPGLTINQGAADDEIISLKSSDIAHGMTSAANTETDTYGAFGKVDGNATAGGLQITGYSESIVGLALQGRATTANTTDGTGARGAVEVEAKLRSGTTTTGYGNSDNALVVRNNETAEFIVKGDGELYSNQSATVATFDEYDDAQLARALDLTHGVGVIDSKFDEFIEYNREKLADLKLIGRDEDGSPNKFVNITRMQRLHNGAIWQGYERQMELQERVEELETKLLALEGAK